MAEHNHNVPTAETQADAVFIHNTRQCGRGMLLRVSYTMRNPENRTKESSYLALLGTYDLRANATGDFNYKHNVVTLDPKV